MKYEIFYVAEHYEHGKTGREGETVLLVFSKCIVWLFFKLLACFTVYNSLNALCMCLSTVYVGVCLKGGDVQ